MRSPREKNRHKASRQYETIRFSLDLRSNFLLARVWLCTNRRAHSISELHSRTIVCRTVERRIHFTYLPTFLERSELGRRAKRAAVSMNIDKFFHRCFLDLAG